MSGWHGKWVWYDLMTTDSKAAEAFYRDVVGWETADSGMSDRSYTILSAGKTMVGGLMPIPDIVKANGGKPHWTGYIAASDVDDYAGRVKAAGGGVHRGPEDIPGVGRFAVASDPQGAMFVLFRGASDQEPEHKPHEIGHIGWHELHSTDQAAGFAFYEKLFGWTKTSAMDMGPGGVYQMFATGGSEPVGGMVTDPPGGPGPSWLFYFTVDAIDAAVARVAKGGGRTVNGPMEVPGGQWIAQCVDPQGAAFAMVAAGR
jgi:uncharacterized protein